MGYGGEGNDGIGIGVGVGVGSGKGKLIASNDAEASAVKAMMMLSPLKGISPIRTSA